MGVPQGLANNLEYLQHALEGLTEATAQEREDNATARAQNEAQQAAVNALQVQMAFVRPGGPAINSMQMQPPPQAHIQAQKITGSHYNNNTSAPPSPPPNQWQAQQASQLQQWQAQQQNTHKWQQYQQQGGYHQQNSRSFQQRGRGRGQATWAPMQWLIIKQAATRQGASKCNAHNSSNNNRESINNSTEDTNILHKYNTVASFLSLPTTHIVGHMGMGLVHSITAYHA